MAGKSNSSEEMFKKNEKMGIILEYILNHLKENLSLKHLSESFHVKETTLSRRFKRLYGEPCERFVMNLRMRDAARELVEEGGPSAKELARKYGFSSMSAFSKAFKRAVGQAPRNFQKSGKDIPDMPLPNYINDKRMYFKYMKVDEFKVYGHKIPVEEGMRTDLLKKCAYPLEYGSEYLDLDGNKDQIGFWWGGAKDELYYVLGHKMYSEYDVPDDAQVFEFGASDYAVFSVEKSDTLDETLLAHRKMVFYAMAVWQKINHKSGNTMAYTYEVFGKNYTWLYLPLWKGMPKEEKDAVQYNTGIDAWIPYIDQHIKENLSIEEIAAHFNYSKRHFCRVFKNYFIYSVAEFIRKERLCLAARDIRHIEEAKERKETLYRYHFNDYEDFREDFLEEFGKEPENYHEVSFYRPNLAQYYRKNKDFIHIDYVELSELTMIGRTIQARTADDDMQDNLDIPDLAAYWMRHDSDEIKVSKYACRDSGAENKIALWSSDRKTGNNEYVLGPVADNITEIPEGFKQITIAGGKYAVLESVKPDDSEDLTEMYRMLSRCAYGWIKEQRYRVDLDRLTFVRYYGNKLHFYVPIYE